MMTHRYYLLPFMLCALVLLTGCKMFEPPTHPYSRVSSYKITELDTQRAEIDYKLRVSNPLDVAVPLIDLEYEIKSRNAVLERRSMRRNELIPARGNVTLDFPVQIDLNELIAKDRSVRPGDAVYIYSTFTSKVLMPDNSEYIFPSRRSVRVPIPAQPDIEITNITWQVLNDNQASGQMTIRIENTNQFEITINSLNYTLGLAGKEVSGGGESQRITLKRNESREIIANINFSPRSIDRSFLRSLKRTNISYGIFGVMWTDNSYRMPMKIPFKDQGRTSVQLPK